MELDAAAVHQLDGRELPGHRRELQPVWNVLSYVSNPPANSASLDLRPFINDSVSRGQLQRAWFLIGIEFGFEIWNGGQSMAVNSFNATVTHF